MGQSEGENIGADAPARQEQIEEDHVQHGGEGVVAHAAHLLGKSFEHPVDNGVKIEHQDHRREDAKIPPGIGAVVDQLAQRVCGHEKKTAHGGGEQAAHADALVCQVNDAQVPPHRAAARELRDEQIGYGIKNHGGEHQNGEYHAVDGAIGGHGCLAGAAVAGKAVGD